MYVNYLKNPLKTFPFFQNCIFFMTGIFKYEAKTLKQKKFRQSLFGNYYSTLNFLSNGIKYIYIICNFKIFKKYFKVK